MPTAERMSRPLNACDGFSLFVLTGITTEETKNAGQFETDTYGEMARPKRFELLTF